MTDLHTDVERYLRYLSVERQLSPITLLNYQRQLEAIINFASENGLQKLAAMRCSDGAQFCCTQSP